MTDTKATGKTPEAITVSRGDLPLSCPNSGTDPSSLHPRVYIPLKKPGDRSVCPYCGAEYVLKN